MNAFITLIICIVALTGLVVTSRRWLNKCPGLEYAALPICGLAISCAYFLLIL